MDRPAALTELVLVRLGGCRYALPMASVAEVGRPPALTRVPGLPAFVAGVANWRGRVLAVLDLRGLLQGGTEPLDFVKVVFEVSLRQQKKILRSYTQPLAAKFYLLV